MLMISAVMLLIFGLFLGLFSAWTVCNTFYVVVFFVWCSHQYLYLNSRDSYGMWCLSYLLVFGFVSLCEEYQEYIEGINCSALIFDNFKASDSKTSNRGPQLLLEQVTSAPGLY